MTPTEKKIENGLAELEKYCKSRDRLNKNTYRYDKCTDCCFGSCCPTIDGLPPGEWKIITGGTDWSKVAVDTPVYVRDHEGQEWHKAHFKEFRNGHIYTFPCGQTSFTSHETSCAVWNMGMIAEAEK